MFDAQNPVQGSGLIRALARLAESSARLDRDLDLVARAVVEFGVLPSLNALPIGGVVGTEKIAKEEILAAIQGLSAVNAAWKTIPAADRKKVVDFLRIFGTLQ